MKKLLLTAILVLAACSASVAHAAERPVTVLLAGGPDVDVLSVQLSQDGRSYLINSLFSPLEADGSICLAPEDSPHDLVCEATAIAGFEVNVGAGNDSVTISPKILAPATLRGGPGRDRLRGGGGADKVVGGADMDFLYGHGGKDWIFGGAGGDWLYGGSGEDRLEGGPGADHLVGGPGADDAKPGPKDQTGAPMPRLP